MRQSWCVIRSCLQRDGLIAERKILGAFCWETRGHKKGRSTTVEPPMAGDGKGDGMDPFSLGKRKSCRILMSHSNSDELSAKIPPKDYLVTKPVESTWIPATMNGRSHYVDELGQSFSFTYTRTQGIPNTCRVTRDCRQGTTSRLVYCVQ